MTRLLRPTALVLATGGLLLGCGADDALDAASPTVAPASATGLDCGDEDEVALEYDVDPSAPGWATEDEAADAALTFYVERHGGERVAIGPSTYGLDLDGRIVVVAEVAPAPAGGFRATTVHVCRSFVPTEAGPPQTTEPVPAATASAGAEQGRSYFLPDADPAVVPVIVLPSDDGEVEARVGPLPDGGPGVCAVDAFGTFPQQVACFEPDENGRLYVPLKSDGQPFVLIDDRVARVTLRSDVDDERELSLTDVPGVPGARITQGTAEFDPDVNTTIAFYDASGVELMGTAYVPPRP